MSSLIETTVLVFKPECQSRHIHYAKRELTKSRLKIIEARRVKITRNIIEKVIMPKQGMILDAAIRHLEDQLLLVLLMEGFHAVESLRKIVGPEIIKNDSGPGSLRATFESWKGYQQIEHLPGGGVYVRNYLHCPLNLKEAAYSIPVLFDNALVWHHE